MGESILLMLGAYLASSRLCSLSILLALTNDPGIVEGRDAELQHGEDSPYEGDP